MTKIVVFDIDGTIADITHRRHWVATKPKNWAAFNAGIVNDTPYDDIVELARMFWAKGYQIILCSGRGMEQRHVTIKQMERFGFLASKKVAPHLVICPCKFPVKMFCAKFNLLSKM